MAKTQRRDRDAARDDLDVLARLLPAIDNDAPALRHRHSSRGVLADDELEQQLEAYFQLRAGRRVWVGGRGRVTVNENSSGPSRLPIDLHARHLRDRITAELHELEYDVAIALNADGYEQESTDLARIRRLRRMLTRLHVVKDLEKRTAERIAGVLALAEDALQPPAFGQLGICPWCGMASLEVDYDAELISCRNIGCECAHADCAACHPPEGKRRSLHQWPRREWDAFAQLCKAADAARENERVRAELVEWIRRQMAARETELRDAAFTARVSLDEARQLGEIVFDPGAELEQIEVCRRRLDEMTEDELRSVAEDFDERPGYREEWRP